MPPLFPSTLPTILSLFPGQSWRGGWQPVLTYSPRPPQCKLYLPPTLTQLCTLLKVNQKDCMCSFFYPLHSCFNHNVKWLLLKAFISFSIARNGVAVSLQSMVMHGLAVLLMHNQKRNHKGKTLGVKNRGWLNTLNLLYK